MIHYLYRKCLNDKQRDAVKTGYFSFKRKLVDKYRRYDPEMLKDGLVSLGLKSGDSVLVHSSFDYFNGFSGTPSDVILCLLDTIGEKGNLMMVSIPYTCSTEEYLVKSPVFNVRRTPSKMGIVSEVFRRKKGTLRSLSPTHPVLAYGFDAAKLVDGHEKCEFACGKDSPFGRFQELDGKVLFFDAPFNNFTFIHYIEDDIKNSLPFELYNREPRSSVVIDYHGNRIDTKVYTFSETAVRKRNPFLLERQLKKEGRVRAVRRGNTKMELVRAGDALRTAREMLRRGTFFYDL